MSLINTTALLGGIALAFASGGSAMFAFSKNATPPTSTSRIDEVHATLKNFDRARELSAEQRSGGSTSTRHRSTPSCCAAMCLCRDHGLLRTKARSVEF